MRKLASLVQIATVSPIEGADKLELATMKGKGWNVVVSKGEFQPDDTAVYFEIDSYLPADDERYAFLRERCLKKFCSKSGQILKEGIRIKTVKLRGQLSQGLLIPIDKYIGLDKEFFGTTIAPDSSIKLLHRSQSEDGQYMTDQFSVGDDLTAILHIEHYDEIADALRPISSGGGLSGDAISSFPSAYTPKSDEERIQNLAEYFTTMKGRLFEVSAKFDGTSTTCFYSPTIDPEHPFGVCSRNNRLKEFTATGVMPIYWQMAHKYDIENKLKSHFDETGDELAIQAETVGCGVNGNRDLYTDNQMFVFRIWDIKKQNFLSPADRRAFCAKYNIPHVQVIAESMPFFDNITSMEEALKFAEGKTLRGHEREGVVLKSCDNGPFVSFKIVSNRYLLKQND